MDKKGELSVGAERIIGALTDSLAQTALSGVVLEISGPVTQHDLNLAEDEVNRGAMFSDTYVEFAPTDNPAHVRVAISKGAYTHDN